MMRVIIDKMPETPETCLFGAWSIQNGGIVCHICPRPDEECKSVADCKKLKPLEVVE